MIRYIFCLFVFCFAFSSAVFALEKAPQKPVAAALPSLLDSIRFEKELSFAGIRFPLENPDCRKRLEKEMLLALWNRPQVILWLKRGARYFPHIEKILKEENLPSDFKYVPVVESALRPHSRSSKGAVGYWQFLRSTGKRHGLRIDAHLDQRRNLFESTRAACRYLTKLHGIFDSYLLALYAYNMGEFGLKSEIEAQETTDPFSIYLPLETQRYLFKIMAAKLIMEHPERYGFFLEETDFYPAFRYAKVNFNLEASIPLLIVAKASGVPFKTIKDMNPDIRGYSLYKGKSTVLVPAGKEKGFKERFATLHSQWQDTGKTRFHVVKAGENLTAIAKKYDMSLPSLLRLNNLSFKQVIHPGDRLRIR